MARLAEDPAYQERFGQRFPHKEVPMKRLSAPAALASGACLAFFVASCSVPAQVSAPANLAPIGHTIRTIAVAPSGGVLADAVGIELLGGGFQVIDAEQTSSLLIRINLSEVEVIDPANLGNLRDAGVDAYLVVRTVGGYDDRPESASVRVMSTHTSSLVAGVTWQNGRSGQQGSWADSDARKNVAEAAAQVAEALIRQLQRGR